VNVYLPREYMVRTFVTRVVRPYLWAVTWDVTCSCGVCDRCGSVPASA